jgi:hypothetical protein
MSFLQGRYGPQGRRVIQDADEIVPPNTKQAYKRHIREFLGFCDSEHSTDQLPRFVTEDKLFGFLFYTAYRPKRPQTKRATAFDEEEFRRVLAAHPADGTSQFDDADSPSKNYVGFSTFDQALSAIISLSLSQRQETLAAGEMPVHLRSDRITKLRLHVKKRRAFIRKARNEEKLDETILPYRMLEHLEPLEEEFFQHASNTRHHGMIALRDRFFYLVTLQAIVRGESLALGTLSDFFCLKVTQQREPHPYLVLMFSILVGKSNQESNTVFGRLIRHKKASMCGVGAFGFYLMLRFIVTKVVWYS